MPKPTALLVGCGKMGGALLNGWRAGDCLERVVIVDPAATGTDSSSLNYVADRAAVPAGFRPDIVVFAVKPQLMDLLVPEYRGLIAQHDSVSMSVAAGKSIASFERYFGPQAQIVRAMPNLPASIGRGITVAIGNERLTEPARALCSTLLEAVGEVAWTPDETHLDAVTAVSGSGPAYVFLLIEALTAAGIKAGLPADLAARLATATVAGSGELARRSPENAAELRRNVTSPKGTTAAALEILMAPGGFQELVDRAIAAAAKRSRELNS